MSSSIDNITCPKCGGPALRETNHKTGEVYDHCTVCDYERVITEQLNCDVTIYDDSEDEYYPVFGIDFSPEDDVLDKNHPFLTVETVEPHL